MTLKDKVNNNRSVVGKNIIDTILDDELLKNHLDIRKGTSGSYYHNYILIALSDTIKETQKRIGKAVEGLFIPLLDTSKDQKRMMDYRKRILHTIRKVERNAK